MEPNKTHINKILAETLQFKYMEEDAETWLELERSKEFYVPVNYSLFFVRYQNLYFSELYDHFLDFSIVIYNGGMPMGIWPLSLHKKNDNWELGSWGSELLPPLLQEERYNRESIRKIIGKCADTLKNLCLTYQIPGYTFRETVLNTGNSNWFQKMMEEGAHCQKINSECFVNLQLTEDEILARIRRTNKYSILKGLNNWTTKIISCKNPKEDISECFTNFRNLHKQVAGRETRSSLTWEMQEQAVINTSDFVVMLYDKENHLVGASLYSTTASACTYSVAAYQRELFDKPLGHVSQWTAIKHMKDLGLRWYYIGARYYPNDWNVPTEKEISISHFKEGFATNIYNTLHIDIAI